MLSRENKVKIIKEIIEKHDISAYKIAKNTTLSTVPIQNIIDGVTKQPRHETLNIILEYLENKIVGTEDQVILKPEHLPKEYKASEEEETYHTGVPYYDVEFAAGFEDFTQNQSINPTSYIKHPFFNGCDYVIRASGQSMAKVIHHGDAIGITKVENWSEFLPFGEIYAIVTKDNFRMIKVVTAGKNENYFTLISKPSDNKKNEFPPQQIKKTHILSIFKVQASSYLF